MIVKRRYFSHFYAILLGVFWGASSAFAGTPPGTIIDNTAYLDFLDGGSNPKTVNSNKVSLISTIKRTPSAVEFLKIAPGYGGGNDTPIGPTGCSLGAPNSGFSPLPNPSLLDGSPIDPTQAQPLASADIYHAGEPIVIRLVDTDQNIDEAVVETVIVTLSSASGDNEQIEIRETDVDTGIFVGYIPSDEPPVTQYDCTLQAGIDDTISVSYRDQYDSLDVAGASALVDPFGVVFDSTNGNPVDGVTVRLIDNATGLPATVFGDDAISSYPATVISGGSVTDSGGTVYNFPPGNYRFPLIAPGDYRLEVVTPSGYLVPSTVTIPVLQSLPGGPFALSSASFGNVFTIVPGPAINIDIPIDPTGESLFVQKSSGFNVAAVGDFIPYEVVVSNPSTTDTVFNVVVTDILPVGFKYLSDSARADGASAADPAIANDGRSLNFSIGNVAANSSVRLNYVAEVTVGARRLKQATNTASAVGDGGASSNVADFTIEMVDDFFADKSFLVGRVIQGSCDDDIANDELGVKGVRIYMEDGRYVVTDEGGRYHFEGVKPGSHVVQLDVDTLPDYLEMEECDVNSRFAGRSFSRFVDLNAGSLWRVDFHTREIPPPNGELNARLNSRLVGGKFAGNTVEFDLGMEISGVDLEKIRPTISLPEGLRYIPNTSHLSDKALTEPRVFDQTLIYDLGSRPVGWQQTLRFKAELTNGFKERFGEYLTKAVVQFDSPSAKNQRTPNLINSLLVEPPPHKKFNYVFTPEFGTRVAELSAVDKREIDTVISQWSGARDIVIFAVGHTDNVPIAARNRHEYADNYALSEARAKAVARYVADRLGLLPHQVIVEYVGPDQPVASNNTAAGRAKNRRVNLEIWGEKPEGEAKVEVNKDDSGLHTAQTFGLSPLEQSLALDVDEYDGLLEVVADTAPDPDVETLDEGFEILWPSENINPPISSIKIVVKHPTDQRLQVSLNGAPVPSTNFDGFKRNRAKSLGVTRWRGIDIVEGNNLLVAEMVDAESGEVLSRIERNVHFSGPVVRAELVPEKSMLLADGARSPIVAVALFDRWGYPARPGTASKFDVDAPYRSMWEVNMLRDDGLLQVGDRDPTYIVDADGVARIALEPTTVSGEVVVNLDLSNNDREEIRAWLEPVARDWILVGLAEGTIGYNTLKDNVGAAEDASFDKNLYEDGRIAFFSKGQIKGKYLLTMAYDTDGDEGQSDDKLFGEIDPDEFYTIYGDATEQRFDAQSQEKLYLKLERGQFFALFGDYNTGLTVTELSNYNRSFNGLQSEYHGERYSYSAFATRTEQAFIKDEIEGDGTSGLYRLSRQPILVNSEKVTIETRDRFHPEVIIESDTLTRFIDYDIDYLQGTLLFKRPVPSRDFDFNPIYIVVDYESQDSQDESTIAGGRGAVKLNDGNIELGFSAIHEGIDGSQSDLLGFDVTAQLGASNELKFEYAESEVDTGTGPDRDTSAFLVELEHQSKKLDARIYTREHQAGFGLGQQRNTEDGTRKMGVEGRYHINSDFSVNGQMYRQENIVDDITRDVTELETRYSRNGQAIGVGYRSTVDEAANGDELASEHAFANVSSKLGKLTLRGSTEVRLDDAESSDFPTRHLVGADYTFSDKATVFAEHEIADGDQLETEMTRAGVRLTPWIGGKVNSTVSREYTEFGPRVFANVGLTQGWQINEKWAMDFGIDHGDTLRSPGFEAFDDDVAPASGAINDDFTAAYIAGLYRTDTWTVDSRFEMRHSDVEDRYGWYSGLYREEIEGHGLSLRSDIIYSDLSAGQETVAADVRAGWAFRPWDTEWIVLNRLDLVYDKTTGSTNDSETWRLVNNMHANWRWNLDNQLGLHYGAKYVRSDVSDMTFTGFTDLIGVDYRRDLNHRWDVGTHADLWHSWNSNVFDFGFGVDVGFNVATNMWFSLGYNFAGFDDDDFSRSRYTAHGPYLRFRIKADQQSLSDLRKTTAPTHPAASGQSW